MKEIFICLFIGYLCGNFLSAVVVTKIKTGKDISQFSTGNPGMANVMINVGKKEGLIVLAGDILKTMLAMGISYYLFSNSLGIRSYLYGGFGCILGHNYPFWRHFKGGKGVTCSVIWLLAIMPVWGCISVFITGILTWIIGYLNLGAIILMASASIMAYIFCEKEIAIMVLLATVIMIIRNRKDIVMIINGKAERHFHH